MEHNAWISLLAFGFFASITPGPNNLMLANSGIRFGFRRTLPHLLGIPVGVGLLLLVCSLGVGALVERLSWFPTALAVLGSAYLLWMTFRMSLKIEAGSAETQKPMSFHQALLFQFINPKAWMIALTAVSIYLSSIQWTWQTGLFLTFGFLLVNTVSISVWALLGSCLRHFLAKPTQRRIGHGVLVGLSLLTLAMLWV